MEIESGAFYGCTNLSDVTIPSSVMKIHPSIIDNGEETKAIGAFYGCTNLTNVTIESPKIALLDELYTITWYAPDGTEVEESRNVYFKDIFGDQVTNYILGDKITNIGDLAFLECSNLKNVILPSNITNIGSGMFSGCSSLTDITIPNSVTSIGGYAFYGCSNLTDITIPNSVTNIGGKAFEGCTSLPVENNIRYADTWAVGVTDKTLARYTLRENTIGLIGAFSDCASLVRITLPTCLTYIGDYAFASCSTLKSLVLPEGVINIGNHAFDNCKNLTSINIPSGVTNIGNYAFFNCTNLTNINIPSNVTNIGEYAFYDCALTEISIPEGITEIMSASFYGNDFKTLEIPEGVTSIEDYAFWDCNVLSSITIPESVTSIGYNAFPDLKSVTLDSPIIFVAGGLADKFGNTVTEYIIRAKIEEIEDYKFYNYSCLQSVILPETLTTIGEGAFEECTSLDSITIPANVTGIKDYAFFNCTALKYICSEALVPPTCGTTTFDGIDTENCILEVPASAVNAYATTAPWSDFNIKVSLTDGEDYENEVDTEIEVITYTRTLNNTTWNALYVPFEIPVSQLTDNYDIAYVNAMHSYDMDDNGEIDKMEMEVVKIQEGTLQANYPYLIRPRMRRLRR